MIEALGGGGYKAPLFFFFLYLYYYNDTAKENSIMMRGDIMYVNSMYSLLCH